MLDFEKYKHRLIEYLQKKDIDAHEGVIFCFNPDHNNTRTPACQISDDHFHCHSGKCGIDGDIYDAAGILENLTDRKDQFAEVEKTLGGSSSYSPPQSAPKDAFIPDTASCTLLESYLKSNPSSEKAIRQFLKLRERNTKGAYPPEVFEQLVKYFLYWPGIDIARQSLDHHVLLASGVPGVNPKTGRSSWDHSGVIIKLGSGYKLHYYESGSCEKRGTKCCQTFPIHPITSLDGIIILVEGEMDELSLRASGIGNAYATGGTNAMTGPKIKKHLLDVPEIIILFDNDESGKKKAGILPLDTKDKTKTNLPERLIESGFPGSIKIALIPDPYKDPDDIVRAGKIDLIKKVIAESKPYDQVKAEQPVEKVKSESAWESFETITIKRLKSLLKKITHSDMDDEDIQPFITACVKACTHQETSQELVKWGASTEQVKKDEGITPYFLIEACEKYGVSKYIKKEIENALIPASELLKRMKIKTTIVDLDFDALEDNNFVRKFIETKGVKSAADLVVDILSARMIYVENEKKHYFFNGHTWQREPDMPGIIYNILASILIHFLQKQKKQKGMYREALHKIEGRRFRVEATQDFSNAPEIFKESVMFDGPSVRESLTLADGVMDFSTNKIIFRKSTPEEYRRESLPYKIDEIKNSGNPKKFLEFMQSNFKNDQTLESLFYYLSLIPSRNTQYKYGGIFVGKTHTGKTTTLELFKEIYPNMMERLPADVLVSKVKKRLSGNEATPYLARLEGKGAAIVQETERNGYLNNALWKELTGGDTQTARGLYKDPHDFIPTAQVILSTNYSPRFDAHDDATIDRMIIIPFSVQHPKGAKGTKSLSSIIKLIKPEAPAIVRFFAEKYISLKTDHSEKIPLSEECANYKASYIKNMATDLDKFVSDCIEFDMTGDVYEQVKIVYERYLSYYGFESGNSEALSQNKFTRYLKSDYNEIDHKQKKIDGYPVLVFGNMRLKNTDATAQPSGNQPKKETRKDEPEPDENPFE